MADAARRVVEQSTLVEVLELQRLAAVLGPALPVLADPVAGSVPRGNLDVVEVDIVVIFLGAVEKPGHAGGEEQSGGVCPLDDGAPVATAGRLRTAGNTAAVQSFHADSEVSAEKFHPHAVAGVLNDRQQVVVGGVEIDPAGAHFLVDAAHALDEVPGGAAGGGIDGFRSGRNGVDVEEVTIVDLAIAVGVRTTEDHAKGRLIFVPWADVELETDICPIRRVGGI